MLALCQPLKLIRDPGTRIENALTEITRHFVVLGSTTSALLPLCFALLVQSGVPNTIGGSILINPSHQLLLLPC
ncbi:hypothetical protein PC116_g18796 [Phytophthora cactorum]|nr:hypothetical protein C6341_g20817 [Phytophthora cactorum]KAG4232973.1 hypothetical protein PC116_g18796 [Phytophthora cactorum]